MMIKNLCPECGEELDWRVDADEYSPGPDMRYYECGSCCKSFSREKGSSVLVEIE